MSQTADRGTLTPGRRVVDQEDVSRIAIERSQKKYTLAALRHAKRVGIHNSVSPFISESLKSIDDTHYRSASVEAKHERHVLYQNPGDRAYRQKREDVRDEPRPSAIYTLSSPGLAQVLAWETGGQEICARGKAFEQFVQPPDVSNDRRLGKVMVEHLASSWIEFTK